MLVNIFQLIYRRIQWFVVVLFSIGLDASCADERPLFVTAGGGGQRATFSVSGPLTETARWGPCGHDENDLMHIAYGDGLFVAGGGWGTPRIVVSRDGVEWAEIEENQFAGASGAVSQILFVDDIWYAVTQMGSFLQSVDAREWSLLSQVPLQTKPKRQRVRDMAFGNGVFVGVGDFGAISVSADLGKSWQVTTAPDHGEDRTWPTVAFGAGKFVIAGNAGYTAASRDGQRWEAETHHDGALTKIEDITWTGREFFAHGHPVEKGPPFRLRSEDGMQWEVARTAWTDQPRVIWRFDGIYYGTYDNFFKGNTKLFRSQDAKNWESIPNPEGISIRWLAGSNTIQ